MTIAQLDTPLRLTWDLHDSVAAMDPVAALTVAGQLVDAGLFYVTLLSRPFAHPEISGICKVLQRGGVQVQAVFCGTAAEWQGVESIASLPEICIDAGAFLTVGSEDEWTSLGHAIERLRNYGSSPALLMVPDRQRLRLIPQLCAFCRSVGVTRIKLPNTPVDASFSQRSALLVPEVDQLVALRANIPDPGGLRAGLTLEVHDLFLWEILFPGERESGRSEYGGCQAANSLAHIDLHGMVHPCSSWLQGLGSLLDLSFVEIWQQGPRFAVLDRISIIPAGCDGCGDYSVCFGGCRGLVATLGTTLGMTTGGRDLLCSGRRSSS